MGCHWERHIYLQGYDVGNCFRLTWLTSHASECVLMTWQQRVMVHRCPLHALYNGRR